MLHISAELGVGEGSRITFVDGAQLRHVLAGAAWPACSAAAAQAVAHAEEAGDEHQRKQACGSGWGAGSAERGSAPHRHPPACWVQPTAQPAPPGAPVSTHDRMGTLLRQSSTLAEVAGSTPFRLSVVLDWITPEATAHHT